MSSNATFAIKQLVAIRIRGRETTPNHVLDDGGLIRRFMEWQHDQGILPVVLSSSGGGNYLAYYEEEDARKIVLWLAAQGAEEQDWWAE